MRSGTGPSCARLDSSLYFAIVKTSIAALVTLSLALPLVAQLPEPKQPVRGIGPKTDLIANVNGRGVHVHVEGLTNGPVVVFENGLGATLESWAEVFPQVAGFARIFAYDRAGNGMSAPAKSERSYTQIAAELHDTLQSQHLQPPYILVGHSFGAIVVRAFCAAYPGEVRAIVFVDPLTENLVMQPADKSAPSVQALLNKAPAGVQTELAFLNKDVAKGMKEAAAFGVPDVPMTLLVARAVRPEGWERAVLDKYQPWVMAREDSSLIVTPGSAQFIQQDEPDLVASSIVRMIYPRPTAQIRRTLRDKGLDAALALFAEDAASYPKNLVTPDVLNTLGYEELVAGRVDTALRLFSRNVQAFPNDSNAYDSLGEAYAVKGDREKAIANYQRSLELNPKNRNALTALSRLRGTK